MLPPIKRAEWIASDIDKEQLWSTVLHVAAYIEKKKSNAQFTIGYCSEPSGQVIGKQFTSIRCSLADLKTHWRNAEDVAGDFSEFVIGVGSNGALDMKVTIFSNHFSITLFETEEFSGYPLVLQLTGITFDRKKSGFEESLDQLPPKSEERKNQLTKYYFSSIAAVVFIVIIIYILS